MGCCCKSQGEVKAMTSIAKNRGCTDLLMLILYILTMTSVPYLMREATFAGADPWRMLRGYDLWGRSCGHAGVPPLAMLPNPIYPSFVVCVNDCSETWEEGTEIMAIRYPSQEIGTYCVPAPWKLAEVNGQVGGNASFFDPVEFLDEIPGAEAGETMLQDIYTARDLYGLVVVVALALSFLWLVLLGKCAKCLFYVSVLLVLVLITGIGITMFALGKEHLDLAEATGQGDLRNKAYVELGLGGFILFVCFIVLLLLCVLRKRINIALAVIKEASRYVPNLCFLVLDIIVSLDGF